MKAKVCHITSVHSPNDIRIFYRECRSLAKAGFDVTLIAPGAEDAVIDGVKILGVAKPSSRIKRMLFTPIHILLKILKHKYKLVHFHDPELIPLGLLCRMLGKKVIFDIHEAVSVQILSKTYLPMRKVISNVYRIFENVSSRFFYLVMAFSTYEEIYSKIKTSKTVVLNLPELGMFEPFVNKERANAENALFYIGGVTAGRAILPLLQALDKVIIQYPDLKFYCLGPVEAGLMEKIENLECYPRVVNHIEWKGRMDVVEGYELSKKCKVGIALLLPQLNYTRALPTKLFEYMAVGLPFITSDFPFFKENFEKHDAGKFVSPENVDQISEEIISMLNNGNALNAMSDNGLKAVHENYSWDSQAKKLINLYNSIL